MYTVLYVNYITIKLEEKNIWWHLMTFRGQTDWNHNHRQLANLITWTTVLSNSMKLSHDVQGHPRWPGHGGDVWQSVVPLEKGMTNHFSILASRTPWTVWKGKRIQHWMMSPALPWCRWVSNMLLANSREITPERMKRLGQSRNSTMLWMCLVEKVKSNV